MTRLMKMVWLAALGFAGLYSGSASAATTMVLCNSNIQGDSQVEGATKCIDILAWSWGASAEFSVLPGGGQEHAVTHFQDISLTKYLDSSSEDLLKFVSTGDVIGGIVELREYETSCSAGCAAPKPFFTIHMDGVHVSSQSGGGSSGDRPVGNITLSFERYSYCYNAPGSKGSPQCFAYDITSNQVISPF